MLAKIGPRCCGSAGSVTGIHRRAPAAPSANAVASA